MLRHQNSERIIDRRKVGECERDDQDVETKELPRHSIASHRKGIIVEKERKNRDHLESALHLPPRLCCDDSAILSCKSSQPCNPELSGQNKCHEPTGYQRRAGIISQRDQHYESCHHEDLVREGIKKLSEIANRLVASRDIPVGIIGQSSKDEDNRSYVEGITGRLYQNGNEYRYEDEPKEGQPIRNSFIPVSHGHTQYTAFSDAVHASHTPESQKREEYRYISEREHRQRCTPRGRTTHFRNA